MDPFEEEPLSAGDMAEGGELPPMEDMENGNQVLPFGNVEDMTGGMEIGESGNAFGQENASEATGLELSGESAGIGDLQDNMDSRIGSETEGAASMGDGAVGSGRLLMEERRNPLFLVCQQITSIQGLWNIWMEREPFREWSRQRIHLAA